MNTISLEARKRLIAEDISNVQDESVLSQIEKILKKVTPSVKRFTIEEVEDRALKSERDIKNGRTSSTEDVRKHLGL
ncbi:hypothetical protein D0T84_09365 [Dysgonomonas sp. 521]|uniref:hypothetical protein n=1 Tax=Dysgonomonas sp. 521 TaxID=2302932 RepID=UPI0013D401F9|nr:hypothetical protein [Dysgonomonas sp. 521]NDV95127.1 hypothetical protein [Dysgonomonas sp. 521]